MYVAHSYLLRLPLHASVRGSAEENSVDEALGECLTAGNGAKRRAIFVSLVSLGVLERIDVDHFVLDPQRLE